MIAATRLAVRLGVCAPAVFSSACNRSSSALGCRFPLPINRDSSIASSVPCRWTRSFREGKNVFVLPTTVGSWQQVENVDWDLVHEAVRSVLPRVVILSGV
ncbi:MAG: hypothetical protein WDN28_02965 [Chthoniobacter sp.]